MQIAVLGSATSWYVGDLRRAAGCAHTILPITYRHLSARVDCAGATFYSANLDLASCDALLVRSMPPGSLEQVVLRMNALARLAASGVQVVNSPRSIEIAVDKFLATMKLRDAGLRVPQTVACQTSDQAMEAFVAFAGDVVVKPLFGGEGRGITRVSDESVALRVFKALEQIGAVIYLQEFIPHEGADLRVMVVGEHVLGMRRRHPTDWRTNISRGATAEPLEVTAELATFARRACAAVGTEIAGVDFLPGKDGQLYTIEVNGVPGWKALAKLTQIDVGQLVLQTLSARGADQSHFEHQAR
ncbi:MAG: RimK family alpha-L-glutamate ligase [Pirellulales bacterium]|nr:RimK family alpha-L-glutamate ligase [Pirellulales bacterium]